MKGFYLLTGMIVSSLTSFSQTNTFPVNGNVGIGTAIPEERLTVLMDPATNGGGIAVKAVNNGGTGSQPGYAYLNSSGSKRMYNYLDIHTDTYNVANAQGSNLLTINQSGNVGIGTSAPLNVLSLRTNANQGLLLTDPNSNNRGALIYDGSQSLLIQALSGPGGSDQATMKFQTADIAGLAQTQMVITRDGNIGMGTSEPKSYKLAVNGKIRTQEIKVENTNWPDYVFEKDYALPSLAQIEMHIKEKGHLSGIPSAEQVKANGIDLGEMNAKLLQKIEELTLHLIEKEKQINTLIEVNKSAQTEHSKNNPLNELKKRIEILEKKQHEK